MNFEPRPEKEWDELDIYDREAADIRIALYNINLSQWVKDLYDLEPKLFEKLKTEINSIKIPTKFHTIK